MKSTNMAKRSAYDTLKAMEADVMVFNNVLQIAYDNIAEGQAAAQAGDLDVAHLKISEICDILEKTSAQFIEALRKHKFIDSVFGDASSQKPNIEFPHKAD